MSASETVAHAAADSAGTAGLEHEDDGMPVTVLSGFLGAGKTSMLKHILKGDHGMKIAVIVNDMAELNVDAGIASKALESDDQLVAMQNGCICCTLREDLLVKVAEIAASGKFDYLVIESTGVSEPLPVAETFTFDAGKNPLMSLARLDTMVTVIDGLNFAEDLESMDYLDDRDWAPKDEDDRNVSQLLIEQVEFADVVVINKTDLISEEQASRISGLVSALNPRAKQIRCVRGAVDLTEILNTHLFDMDVAAKAPGWLKELRGEHVPETDEYGISSFVFRSRRPFHPQRLDALLDSQALSSGVLAATAAAAKAGAEAAPATAAVSGAGADETDDAGEKPAPLPLTSLPDALQAAIRGDYGCVVRSKGLAWLASEGGWTYAGDWAHAGRLIGLEPSSQWWASIPKSEWPAGLTPYLWSDDAKVGDRLTEVVIIGIGMDKTGMQAALEACLLTDEEFEGGPEAWKAFPDPIWFETDWDEFAAKLKAEAEEDAREAAEAAAHSHEHGHEAASSE